MIYSINSALRKSNRFKNLVALTGCGDLVLYGLLARLWECLLARAEHGVYGPFRAEDMFRAVGLAGRDVSGLLRGLVECGERENDGYLVPWYEKFKLNVGAFEEHFSVTWAVRFYQGLREVSDEEFEKLFAQTLVEIYDPDSDAQYKGMVTVTFRSRELALKYRDELCRDLIRKRRGGKKETCREKKTDLAALAEGLLEAENEMEEL